MSPGTSFVTRLQSTGLPQLATDYASDAALWIRPDGRIAYANLAACRELGNVCDEILPVTIRDFNLTPWGQAASAIRCIRREVGATASKGKRFSGCDEESDRTMR